MTTWLAHLLAVTLAGSAAAADWRETLSPPMPGSFPPPRALKAEYHFGWSGFTAAAASFQLVALPQGQLQLSLKTQTTGFVRTLWRMDSQHTAVCDAATLRPIRLLQTEIYKGETERTATEYSPTVVTRQTEVTPSHDPPEKLQRFKFPNVFDLQTGLFFVRSQRLQIGDRYRFVVYPSSAAYLAEIEVLGRERMSVPGGTYPAIKCELRLQRVTKKFALTPHRKFKRAYAWISEDRDRLVLRIEAEIAVGSVWAELQSVEFEPKS